MDSLFSNMYFLVSAWVFVAFVALAIGAFYYADHKRQRSMLIDKIRGLVPGEEAGGNGKKGKGIFTALAAHSAAFFGRRMKPAKTEEMSAMKRKLLRAGFGGESAVYVFLGSRVLCAALLAALFLALRVHYQTPMPRLLALTLMFAAFGFYLPGLFLNLRISGRRDRIMKGFPDALDLMVVCVEAGMGLDAAISRVGEEIKYASPELGEEFRLLSLELRAGKPRRDAMKNFADRIDHEDVASLVSLIIQTDKFGTEVARSLRVYSDSMRTKRLQRAEEKAQKLPTKLIFPLMFFIFPVIMIAILGPAAIQTYRIFFK